MKIDPNDYAAAHGPDALREAVLAHSAAAEAMHIADVKKRVRSMGLRELLTYDTSDDPNCLLGRRWMCKGGACLLIGQSGLGKSSFTMQSAITWALGESLFGIKPVKPLKSLVIQAENDKGDLAEELKGVLNGMEINSRVDELEEQLIIVSEESKTGADFCEYLIDLLQVYQPDLLWIDPLLSYIGGDISDQKTVSEFLRNRLNPVIKRAGVGVFITHHTGKPSKNPAERNGFTGNDFSYMGIGSSELVNWARAVLVLREVEDSLYELRAAKRGKRAGLSTENNTDCTAVHLQHGTKGICWERAGREPAKSSKEKPAPNPNEHETFRSYLTHDWQHKKTITDTLSRELKLTAKDAGAMCKRMEDRYGLHGLHSIQGVIDCGIFEAKKASGSLCYKLKDNARPV